MQINKDIFIEFINYKLLEKNNDSFSKYFTDYSKMLNMKKSSKLAIQFLTDIVCIMFLKEYKKKYFR